MVGQAQVLPGSRSGSTFMIRGLCLPCYDPSLPPLSAYSLTPISACGVGYQWSGVRPVAGQVVDLVGQEFASSVQARTPLAGRRVSLTDHRRRRAHLCDTLRLRRYREHLDAHATAHPAWFHRSHTHCRVALLPGTSSTVRVDQSAQDASQPGRKGGEFFTAPSQDAHRRYEALRAYFVEGLTAAQAARRFDYSVAAVNSAVRDFRAGRRQFFTPAKPGPRRAPAKDAARDRVLVLRASGHSIDEIATALAAEGTPLNRTGIAEILSQAGVPRIWRRPEQLRGAPRREQLPRAGIIDLAGLPAVSHTRM